MAIVENGIMGTVTGKIGPITSYIRNGRNVLRSRKNNGVVRSTKARLGQREKIEVCNAFTRAFTGTGFFNITFPAYGQAGTGYNRATSTLMNLAVTGNYPGQSLSWPKVMIARGPLPGAENVSVTIDPANNCLFTWTDNSNTGTAHGTDKVILCAFHTTQKTAVYSLDAGMRKDLNSMLDINSLEPGEFATWISFINSRGDVADSVFAGMVQMV